MSDRGAAAIRTPWPQRASVARAGPAAMVGPGRGVGNVPANGNFPSLTGLAARYRADLGVTRDGSNLVGAWADLSGNGRNLAEGTNLPLWVSGLVNGRPAIRFDGFDDKLRVGSVALAAPQTLIIVARLITPGGIIATLDSAGGPDLYHNGATTLSLEANGTGGSSVAIPSGYFTAIVVADAGTSTMQINNGTVDAVSNIGMTGTEICLGSRTSGQAENGEIAEFAVLSGAIGATDRAALLAYLQQTYGLW